MSYQVFARKYRPRTFDDVLGQDHVIHTLRNAIEQKRIAHAYLLVGPRGTGKTTTARILAKALNCPDGPKIDFDPDHEACVEIAEGRALDVLEIDGASNNGVEQVRELRETVAFAPARGPYKIYYIDEVHMLSNAAFNALLKTLEEPPEHVKFIFATTEPNKILPTIISRCQRFDLRPIPTEIISKHLLHIAEEESVALDHAAAWAIAKGAEGGMRDAQSMLDQLVAFCGEKITEANVLDIFGFTSRETVATLIHGLLKKEAAQALTVAYEQFESGKDLSQFLAETVLAIRALVVSKIDSKASREGFSEALWADLTAAIEPIPAERLLALIDVFAEAESRMKWASNKRLHFELACLKAIQSLNEIRLSDVIKTMGKVQVESVTANRAASPPLSEPSHPEPTSSPKTTHASDQSSQGNTPPEKTEKASGIDALIASAPDEPEEISTPPAAQSAPPKNEEKTPEPEPEIETNDFHNDPLVQEALKIFKGTLVS